MTEANYWGRMDRTRVSRRTLLRGTAIGGAGLAAMGLVGCTGSDSGGGGGGSQVPAELKVADSGLLGRLETLDPNVTTVPGNGTNHLFDPILELGVDYRVGPAIAESWEQPDELTWILTIRQGATFHNGDPVTAEDVKFTLDRIVDPANKFPQSVYFAPFIDKVEVEGNRVRLHTKPPNAVIPNRLNLARVVPKKYLETAGLDGFRQQPIGSGPYKFNGWTEGQNIRVTAFENYWRGRPPFPAVQFQNVGEEATRVSLIRTGSVHLADNMPPELLANIEAEGLKVQSAVSAQIVYIAPNAKIAPFNDKRVRQALALIVDGEAIKQGVFRGKMDVLGSAAAPPSNGYDGSIAPYEQNLQEARRLLEAAGVGTNFTLPFLARATGTVFQRTGDVAQAVAEQLRSFGIQVQLDLRAASEHMQEYLKGEYPGLHQYTCGDILGDISHCVQLLFRNRALYYRNEELVSLIEKMDATLDNEERSKVQREVLRFIHDDYAWTFMYAEHHNFAMHRNLQFQERPDGYYNMMVASWG